MINQSKRDKASGILLRATQFAFAATIILLPLRVRSVIVARPAPPIYKDFTDFLLFASDISLSILLIAWGLSLLIAWRGIKLGPGIVWIPIAGLLFMGLVSCFSSIDRALSIYNQVRLVLLFLFYLYIINVRQSQTLVIISIALQVLILSGVGVAQFMIQRSIGLQAFGEHILDPAVSGVSIVYDGSTRLLRAYSLTEHPNLLGGCLAFGLIILLAAYVHGRENTRWIISPILLLGLLALFLTFSRSAWIALFAAGGLLLWVEASSRHWGKIKSLLWLPIASLLLLLPFIWTYREYIGARLNVGGSFEKNQYENRSIGERLLLDQVAWRIFLENPIQGVGVGTSALAIREYDPDFPGSFVPPHFTYLTVAVETGFLGAIFYILLSFLPLLVLLGKRSKLAASPCLTTITSLLLAMTLIGFLDIYPWLLAPGRLWQWLIWGSWAVAYQKGAFIIPIEQEQGTDQRQ